MPSQNILTSPEIPISSSLSRFTHPIHQAINKTSPTTTSKSTDSSNSELETTLWSSWHDLITTARSTAHTSQSPLVELTHALHNHPDPKTSSGERALIWNEQFSWKNLPLFGAAVREAYNESPEQSDPQQNHEGWINLNAFLARLTALSENPHDVFDFSLFGIWALRSVFEDFPSSSSSSSSSQPSNTIETKLSTAPDIQEKEEEEEGEEQTGPTDIEIQAAAVWIIYAGEVLKSRSVKGVVFEGKSAREGEGFRGRGWRGLCVERWEVWGEGLRRLEREGEGEGEMGRLVGLAVESMGLVGEEDRKGREEN